MNAALRPIAVYVEEPTEGAFVWVLNERGPDGQWTELERAQSHSTAYKQAMASGLWKLQSLIPDLDAGPRGPVAATPAKPRRGKVKQGSATDKPSSTPHSVFGFGLAN